MTYWQIDTLVSCINQRIIQSKMTAKELANQIIDGIFFLILTVQVISLLLPY